MSESKQIKVGFGPRDYSAYRAFQRVPVPDVTFVREPYLPIRRMGKWHPKIARWSQGFGIFIPTGRADLYHSYNAVLLNQTPWIVSFECQFPRVWETPSFSRYLLAKAASASCRKVIAMSENAKTHLIRRNKDDPSLSTVLEKTTVIHPFTEDDPEAFECRKSRGPDATFRMIFVGNEFFRKGGNFAVEAFLNLRRKFSVHMTVVSSLLETNDIYSVKAGEGRYWKDRMASMGIDLYQSISSQEVRKLMARADVLLLPTLEDSFGYSMTEAMSTGIAVVATGVEAVPEIVEDKVTGRVIDVPVTEERRIIWSSESGAKITERLTAVLDELFTHPHRLIEMGLKGRDRYMRMFHPDVIGEKLAVVYREASAATEPARN